MQNEVSVGDTGGGIPEEIRDRIFNPFFTTKPAGEGSGLGLDICKKIIEKHGGSISFQHSLRVQHSSCSFPCRFFVMLSPSAPALDCEKKYGYEKCNCVC